MFSLLFFVDALFRSTQCRFFFLRQQARRISLDNPILTENRVPENDRPSGTHFVLFHSCNFLGLSTRGYSNYPEVRLARVLSGCFGCATFLTTLLLCSMAGFLYSLFVSAIVFSVGALAYDFLCSRPLCFQPMFCSLFPLHLKKRAPSSRGRSRRLRSCSRNAEIQKALMGVRLRRHVGKRKILKILMGSHMCLILPLVSFLATFCLSMLFSRYAEWVFRQQAWRFSLENPNVHRVQSS